MNHLYWNIDTMYLAIFESRHMKATNKVVVLADIIYLSKSGVRAYKLRTLVPVGSIKGHSRQVC